MYMIPSEKRHSFEKAYRENYTMQNRRQKEFENTIDRKRMNRSNALSKGHGQDAGVEARTSSTLLPQPIRYV